MKANALEVISAQRKIVANLRRELFAATTIPEVKVLLAASKTAEVAIRELEALNDEGRKAECEASELVIRVKRRMGELLATMERREVGGDQRSDHSDTVSLWSPTLADLGLGRKEASRYQRIAEVPQEKFEHVVADTIASGKPITQAAVIRLAPITVQPCVAKRKVDWSSFEDKIVGVVRGLMAKCPPEFESNVRETLLMLADECVALRKGKHHG